MCLECRELDRVIAHYRELRPQVTDRLTLEGIDLLIAEAEAKRGRYTSKDVFRQVTSLGSDGSLSRLPWQSLVQSSHRKLLRFPPAHHPSAKSSRSNSQFGAC